MWAPCTFAGLEPGGYLVAQTIAPPGFAKVDEPFAVTLADGEAQTVAFTNIADGATIAIALKDDAGQPVSGATFAVFADPDTDGKVAPDAQPTATCVTDDTGACQVTVPMGNYVLSQIGAADGLAPIQPVAFALTAAGQTAVVDAVNRPADTTAPAAPPGETVAVGYQRPVATPPVVRTAPQPDIAVSDQPDTPVHLPEAVGSTIVRVIRAPGEAVRLFARDPLQALAWTATLALFAMALIAVARRRQALGLLVTGPAGAQGGHGSSGSGAPPRGPQRARQPGGTPSGPTATLLASAGATAVLERPPVAGAAPAVAENVSARVIAATADPMLRTMVTSKLVDSTTCELVAVAASLAELHEALRSGSADVLIVDLALRTEDGKDTCDLALSLGGPARILGLLPAGRPHQGMAVRAHRAGLGGMLVAPDDVGNGQLAYSAARSPSGCSCHQRRSSATCTRSGSSSV